MKKGLGGQQPAEPRNPLRGSVFTHSIVSPCEEKRKGNSVSQVFKSFYDAASRGCRTKAGWARSLRTVIPGSAHGVVVRAEGIALGLIGHEVVLEDLGNNRYRIATDYASVYALEQTRQFTPRRAAQQRYLDIFFTHARKDQYGLWDKRKDDWSTVTAEDAERLWDRKTLTGDLVLRHANHSDTLALKSDGKTHFVVVDLDCHKKDDVDLFLRRAERLLQRFHGDGWHYQLKDGTISGIHFIKVLDWPWRLDKARNWVADQLRQMDEPGLDLMSLEIYPTLAGNGIRLPLAKGYLMILDQIVDPVTYRRQQVGDVKRYVDWLDDENRQYFPKDRLLSFLRMNVPDSQSLPLIDGSITLVCKKDQAIKPEGHGLGPMKGCFWSKLTDYWSGRWNPPGALDEAITMTARVGYKMGYTEAEIISILKPYSRSLPQAASSRLDNPRELNRCILKQVRGLKDNGKQKDAKLSDHILDGMAIKWKAKGLDLLDKTTWDRQVIKSRYDFVNFGTKVSAEDLQAATAYLVTTFPQECQVVAKQSIERIMLLLAGVFQGPASPGIGLTRG